MKLRIVGDGTPHGTRVETEDGELVHGVSRILLVIDIHGQTHAVVSLAGPHAVDVSVNGSVVADERTGRMHGPLGALFASTAEDTEDGAG